MGEVGAMVVVMTAQHLVLVMTLRLVVVMAELEDCMEVGEVIVAVVVTILTPGRLSP